MRTLIVLWRIVLVALVLTCVGQSVQAGETVVYYHTDALRSVSVVTNAQGQVIERTYYAPYGAVLNRPLRDGPGYTGHREDAETGLVYMQQWYYDPEIGRFLSPDPVQTDANTGTNFNRYWYAKDNPYRYTDPDGRNITEFIGGLFVETAHFVTGQGFNGSAVAGALVDGYNGEGGGVLHAALQDAFTASSVAGVAGAIGEFNSEVQHPTQRSGPGAVACAASPASGVAHELHAPEPRRTLPDPMPAQGWFFAGSHWDRAATRGQHDQPRAAA